MHIELFNHAGQGHIAANCCAHYQQLLERVLPDVLQEPVGPEPVLFDLWEVEMSFVDDETMAQVHEEFMGIAGTTDVITFHHGEILISPCVAVQQAKEWNEDVYCELFRYMVHGLLHLHGYWDHDDVHKEAMFAVQERLVEKHWRPLGAL